MIYSIFIDTKNGYKCIYVYFQIKIDHQSIKKTIRNNQTVLLEKVITISFFKSER